MGTEKPAKNSCNSGGNKRAEQGKRKEQTVDPNQARVRGAAPARKKRTEQTRATEQKGAASTERRQSAPKQMQQ